MPSFPLSSKSSTLHSPNLHDDAPRTVFNLGSMCKGFTVLAVGCLVADGKVHWDDCIDKFIQDLRGTPNGKFTIRDLLSHRRMDVFAQLDAARPPRQDFLYNNFGYHAVGCVIEQVSSMNYGEFLAQRVFRPLNMDRTFTKPPPTSDQNVAKAYVPYCNLQLREVPPPAISDDTVVFSAGGIRSCMRDLLIFFAALLRKFAPLAPEPVLGDVDLGAIFGAVIPLPASSSLREQSYGMGWARAQLPNQMSEINGNSGLLDSYPTIGGADNASLVFHHGGNNIGCSSTVYLFPELQSGIVVLGNALAHSDATDWTAQVLTEAYLCGIIDPPFSQYVASAALKWRSAMESVQAVLDKERKHSCPPANLEPYTGTFWHKTHLFCIVVTRCAKKKGQERGQLVMKLQGRDDEAYTLRHYHQDTFVFNETFDQVVNRGQWCRPHWFYKIEFIPCESGTVDSLRWRIDDTQELKGHIFERQGK
ncbi:Beta-lactamase/transpeptidase-like protein [Rhypophila sp. PSN 637]